MGVVSLAGYGTAALGLRGTGRAEDVFGFIGLFATLFAVYFGAVWRSRTSASKATAAQVLFWALLFRLSLLPAGLRPDSWPRDLVADLRSQAVTYRTFLLYDNDVWRYLWGGHVLAAGIDPYAHSPAEIEERAFDGDPRFAPLLEEDLWQDVLDNVGYPQHRTVYPPLALYFFRLLHALAPGSVFAYKLALVFFDFGTCLLLASLLRRRGGCQGVLIYAWNPLAVKEIAGSGHVDSVLIFFLVLAVWCLARGWRRAGLVTFALAVLVKLTPLLLAGLFLRRARPRDWPLLPLTLFLGYLPFLGSLPEIASGLQAFAREWIFNPGPWALLQWLSSRGLGLEGRGLADAVAAAATLALVAWATWRDDGGRQRLVAGCSLILGGYVVLSATVMPWYLLWALPFVAADPHSRARFAWPALTCLSLLSYLIYIDQVEHPWAGWTQFLCFFLLLALGQRKRPPGILSSP